MTDTPESPGSDKGGAAVDEVVVRESKGLPVVWIIPLVAIAIGGWLWIQALREQGPEVTISFATAEGLEVGKTHVKFKDIEVGQVKTIDFTDDLSGVLVTVELVPEAKPYMRDSTRFWVVRPRIGVGGVSGLGTLLSGAYIGMDPGTTGAIKREFTGLELPPLHADDDGGLKVQLTSDTVGSHNTGTPVYYRQNRVGVVERTRFTEDGKGVEIDLYIESEYKHFLHANSRFWDTSGVRASLGADGIEIQMESLDAVLAGGIAFGVPAGLEPGPPAEAEAVFELYPDQASSALIRKERRLWVLFFDESVRGVAVGAPVEFRGLKLGEVVEVRAQVDLVAKSFWIPVIVATYPDSLELSGLDPDLSTDERQDLLLERGMRARLQTGSMLTGAKYIDIDFFSDAPLRLTGLEPDLFEVPTVPSSGAQFSEAMAKLPDILDNVDQITGDLADILGSEQTKETLASIHDTAAGVETLVANVNSDVEPLVADLKQALEDADALLETANHMLSGLDAERPELQYRVNDALVELAGSLRSLRALTDYLERHPEALLKGKGGE